MKAMSLDLSQAQLARLGMNAEQARAKGYFIYREKLVNAYRGVDAFDFKILLERSQITSAQRSFLLWHAAKRGLHV